MPSDAMQSAKSREAINNRWTRVAQAVRFRNDTLKKIGSAMIAPPIFVDRDAVFNLLSCRGRLRFGLREFRAIEWRVVLHFDDANGDTGGRFKPRAGRIHGYQIGKPHAASRVAVVVIIYLKWSIAHGRG